jgi:nanoRNase/pAp phosphatase (c-di-AMP/oligoRNAs hydrolase)
MALPELTQAASLLAKSSSVLLVVPEKPSSDAFATMLALYLLLLDRKDVKVDAVSPAHVPRNLQFLPGSSQVHMNPQIRPSVMVDIAGPSSPIEIRQEKLQGGVRLHLMLSEGFDITKDQVETTIRALPYDLVITIGAADLEELGKVFTGHADFFYNIPIINIDNRATNEHFGTVNIVDITASSTAEVAAELIGHITNASITPDIATALYAGIVAATDSFQKPSTTPRCFQLAADLLQQKADKESVIQHLVKTKPLSLLKLSGRTYARLRYDEHGQLFWSLLRAVDFQESGATPQDIPDVMKELTNNISGFNAAFLILPGTGEAYDIYLVVGKGLWQKRKEIEEQLGAKRSNGAMRLSIQAPSPQSAEETILAKIRSILP